MAPRTGRPKSEDSRTERIAVYLSKNDYSKAEKARENDKEPEKSLAAWLARKISEMLKSTDKK